MRKIINEENSSDFVGFHNPDEENGYLSNWYLSKFTVNDVEFSSMEQYMMYEKAVYFKDAGTAEKYFRQMMWRKLKRWVGRLRIIITATGTVFVKLLFLKDYLQNSLRTKI